MKNRKKLLLNIFETIIISAIISFVMLNFIVLPCKVYGKSMVPTLNDGDYGWSFIISKNLDIKRFEICVINTHAGEKKDKLIVKRIIGLPNETVEYKNNKLYINGEYIEENFINDTFTNDFVVTLKNDEYYCLGDNRSISKDSRYYGPFKKEDIVSTNMFVIYPFSEFGVKK